MIMREGKNIKRTKDWDVQEWFKNDLIAVGVVK